MPTYDIYRIVRAVERYSVTAEDIAEARSIYDAGEASLREDEVTDVFEMTVIERGTSKDVTSEWDEIEVEREEA